MQLLNNRAENASKAISASEEKKNKINVERTQTRDKISSLKKESSEKQSKITELRKEIDSREKEEIDLQKKLRIAVSNAEEAKSALSMNGNRNTVVAAILKAAKKGGPLESAGVRGRLGDLGTIPAEYDVAISTACSSLDNIVVNTVVGAEACMKYLREYNIGRGSFLPLERVEQCKASMEKSFNAPQGSTRLFDLVTAQSDDLKVAFYYTLRDTLVVKDQITANKVAFAGEGGRPMFKVVTVEGSMIETSGTMAGGGAPKSGSMKLQRFGKKQNSIIFQGSSGLPIESNGSFIYCSYDQLKNFKLILSKMGHTRLEDLKNC
jgi:structural maintenance of chromosome 4